MSKKPLLPVEKPEIGVDVFAVIKHCEGNRVQETELKAVDESDCDWRFSSDDCALVYDYDAIYWEYK